MGPVPNARRLSFPSLLPFSSSLGQLHAKSLHKFAVVRVVVILISAGLPLPTIAQTQSTSGWSFRFSKPVRWGEAVLPPGDYTFSISADATPVVTVSSRDLGAVATVVPKSALSGKLQVSSTQILTENDGHENYVMSVYVKDTGQVLTFAPPSGRDETTAPPKELAPEDSTQAAPPSTDEGLFSIRNPRGQPIPQAEAEAIYLSACKVVEDEFNLTSPLRPHLTLVLGAASTAVYYPKREIQLAKWDKYDFAQGVVLLAMDNLLPLEKRLSLTKLAILQAESTIDVSDLKSGRTIQHFRPQN